MPIVKVDDKGTEIELGEKSVNLKKWSRRVAIVCTGCVAAGVFKFFAGDPAMGLLAVMLGGAISSIWNLADD